MDDIRNIIQSKSSAEIATALEAEESALLAAESALADFTDSDEFNNALLAGNVEEIRVKTATLQSTIEIYSQRRDILRTHHGEAVFQETRGPICDEFNAISALIESIPEILSNLDGMLRAAGTELARLAAIKLRAYEHNRNVQRISPPILEN